ncbi:MAG: diguanylate cyclase [Deltaproteobacteria bacterium]|jgi:two-component system, cell cycle response regulator|nr:diguanylate cyclase [Deltaproteobacteria bacterium]
MEAEILIVDDDDAIRDAMQEFLDIYGYKSIGVSSAEKAVELLRIKPIQVIITDILLPGMDGLQLTDLIKNDYDIDIIVMTGYSGDYSYEEAISKGASDFVFKPVRFEELVLRLKRVLRERKLTNERVHMLEKLKKLSITDGLTRLYNSRHFYNQLKGEVDRSNRYKHPLSLLILDIDHFKDYNDSHGHLEGDKVLIRIGQVVKPLLRKMDSAYRYGGEEFTIILPETDGNEAQTVAQRIRKAVKMEKFLPESSAPETITISLGVTEYSPGEDVSALIQRADKALYKSKEGGRDRVSALFVN